MQNISNIVIFMAVGGLIGYFTNALAIYMLFHPRKSFLGVQGAIPKRKTKLAEKIAGEIHVILPEEYKKIASIPVIGKKIDSAIKRSIAKTIKNTPDEDIERTIKNIIKTELRFIEILGGIIGMLIGLVQGIIFYL